MSCKSLILILNFHSSLQPLCHQKQYQILSVVLANESENSLKLLSKSTTKIPLQNCLLQVSVITAVLISKTLATRQKIKCVCYQTISLYCHSKRFDR